MPAVECSMDRFRRKFFNSRLSVVVPLLLLLLLPACQQRSSQEEERGVLGKGSTTGQDNPLVIRHRLRTAVKDGWKAEVWLNGSWLVPWRPVNICLRLTPEDKSTNKVPRVKVQLAIAPEKDGSDARKSEVEPHFGECAAMEKCREQAMIENGWRGKTEQFRRGEVTQFPPRGPCWQTVIRDAFKSNQDNLGTVSFESGDYVLKVTVILEGGPEFRFEEMRLTIRPLRN
jgi:hypothetical protein